MLNTSTLGIMRFSIKMRGRHYGPNSIPYRVHIIPLRIGDIENSKGGVQRVIPAKNNTYTSCYPARARAHA